MVAISRLEPSLVFVSRLELSVTRVNTLESIKGGSVNSGGSIRCHYTSNSGLKGGGHQKLGNQVPGDWGPGNLEGAVWSQGGEGRVAREDWAVRLSLAHGAKIKGADRRQLGAGRKGGGGSDGQRHTCFCKSDLVLR